VGKEGRQKQTGKTTLKNGQDRPRLAQVTSGCKISAGLETDCGIIFRCASFSNHTRL